jgi:hypothetical protein
MGMFSFKWGMNETAPKSVKVMFFQDYLKEANKKITKGLKEYSCFDLDFPTKFLKHLYWLLEERNLTYRDPGFGDFSNKTTIVVGVQGADFEDHERRR